MTFFIFTLILFLSLFLFNFNFCFYFYFILISISIFIFSHHLYFQGGETVDSLSIEIDNALRTSQRLIIRQTQYKSDGSKFPCLLALHPVFKCVTKTNSSSSSTSSFGRNQHLQGTGCDYVRVTEDMVGADLGPSHSVEYKYQIWLFIDCNISEEKYLLEITEMARILRILPQTVLNDYLDENTAVVAELENLCNIRSFSRSFYAEIVEKSLEEGEISPSSGAIKEDLSKDSIKGIYCHTKLFVSFPLHY